MTSLTLTSSLASSSFFLLLLSWKDLFDDTEEARSNLAKLQDEYDTFECFYFPFCFTGKLLPVYEENPDLYVWLGGTTPPKDTVVYEPTDEELFGADLTQHMGIYMLEKLFKNATAEPALYSLMPYLASMMFLNLLLTVTPDNKPCAWKIPQWRESHPFNAIGSVEGVPCCDIEWSLQMNTKQGKRDTQDTQMHRAVDMHEERGGTIHH